VPSVTGKVGAAVLVAQPETPGYEPLPGTVDEVQQLQKLIPHARCLLGASGQQLIDSLRTSSIVHLACHGERNREEPLKSGLVLSDGLLDLPRLMNIHVPDATFAFLSVCESAMGGKDPSDEATHLAATMLHMGFHSVVGTLWCVKIVFVSQIRINSRGIRSMDDDDGPIISKLVYQHVMKRPLKGIDFEDIPRALDAAVRVLRISGVHPCRWATWIHMGI
jgi:hypothetical protein